MAAVLPGGGEIEFCVHVDMQRGRSNMLWGWEIISTHCLYLNNKTSRDAGFIINHTVGTSEKN